MSTTYNIECHDCKQTLWIGQGDHIYTGDHECMEDLNKFLFEHENHNLTFVKDDNVHDEYTDYEDLDNEPKYTKEKTANNE